MTYVPTDVEIERRNRIRLALFAYAYEFEDDSIVSDAEFDALAYKIRKEVKTGHKVLDKFFLRQFEPHTGQWIHKHPELGKLKAMYFQHKHGYDARYYRMGDTIIDWTLGKVIPLDN
jgi:hypothetical protein